MRRTRSDLLENPARCETVRLPLSPACNRAAGTNCTCMIAVGRQLDERSGGRHRGSGEGISAPACNRAGESDCTLMVVAGGNAVERSFRRDLFAVQAESPAIDA